MTSIKIFSFFFYFFLPDLLVKIEKSVINSRKSIFLFFLGDVLVYFNDKNLFQSSSTIKHDRIKSEFLSLRRHHQSIRIGICRATDRSVYNNKTIKHLASLTWNDFEQLSLEEIPTPSLNDNRNSSISHEQIVQSKKYTKYELASKPLIKKRSTSPTRDSGFIETDGTNTSVLTDRSLISNPTKHRSKSSLEKSEDDSFDTHKSLESFQQSIPVDVAKTKLSGLIYKAKRHQQRDLPTQIVTDACFVYRQKTVKHEMSDDDKAAIIHRGREIAYEAANTPSIPSSMPNYTRDQIRELYGDLDRQTQRLQEEEEFRLPTPPVKNSISEKPQWKLAAPRTQNRINNNNNTNNSQCPLPKFRLEKSSEPDPNLLMAAYLSTGLDNSQMKSIAPVDNFHTVMMNASAKVNEWANYSDIYLSPVERDQSQIDQSSPLLIDIQFNLKKLAGTPTETNDRPTVLQGIEQQTSLNSNQTTLNRSSRGSIRKRKSQTLDTNSSSPDSVEIVFETTPSTPGSCGMYLEPYMRSGYDLPTSDSHIRDSSWKDDEKLESVQITPIIESPIISKFESDSPQSPPLPMTSQMIDSDSLIDFDDGTNSYHTAKDSRLDHTHRSTISIASDETNSTIDQHAERDDLNNKHFSSDGSFYYDAQVSPSQANQQTISSNDKQNVLIDNLTNLLEQIETFHRTNQPNSTTIKEKQFRSPPEGKESNSKNDQLTTMGRDIHQLNQPNATDHLLFIYDEIDDEQRNVPNENLGEVDQWIQQTPTCVNNLLFIYDETITPTDDQPKIVANDSDEWSYDNLMSEQEEQVNTDHLCNIVYEALPTRFEKPIKFKTMNDMKTEEDATENIQESPVDTDNLGTIVHQALTARFQKPIKTKQVDPMTSEVVPEAVQKTIEESVYDTDHLGTIVHEALAARSQQPIKVKTMEEASPEVPTETYEETDDEPTFDTDHLGTIVHEALAARSQQPIKVKTREEASPEVPTETYEETDDEPIFDTDHLGTIVHEALAARSQQPIKVKTREEASPEVPTETYEETDDEPTFDTDHLGTIVHEALAARSQQPIKVKTREEASPEVPTETYEETDDELTFDTDHLGTIVHEALAARSQQPIKVKTREEASPEVPTETYEETDDEPTFDTDHLGTIVHEALAARSQQPIKVKTREEASPEVPTETYEETDDEPIFDTDHLGTIVHEALAARFQKPIKVKTMEEASPEVLTATYEETHDEPIVDTDHLGTIVHEALTARSQKPIKVNKEGQVSQEVPVETVEEKENEEAVNTDSLGTIIHDVLTTRFQRPIKVTTTDHYHPDVLTENVEEINDEPFTDTTNIPTETDPKAAVELDHNCFVDQSSAFSDESPVETSEDQFPMEQVNESHPKSRSSSFGKSTDGSSDDIHRSETIVYEIEPSDDQENVFIPESDLPPPVAHLSQIVSDSLLTSSNYHRHHLDQNQSQLNITHQSPMYDEEIYEEYGYRRTTTDPENEDIVEKFEELCQRYSTTFNQYEKTRKKFDDDFEQFEKELREKKEEMLTPVSDSTSEELITTIERIVDHPDETTMETSTINETEESYETIIVHRQPDYLGKYGFDVEEFDNGKVKISSIIDEHYCPNLHSGDEIVSINNNQTIETSDQCQSILDSLWKSFDENIEITIIKPANIPNVPSK